MGALAITGLPGLRHQFEPLVPGAVHVANTNRFRSPFGAAVAADDDVFARACADAIEAAIVSEGPETVAAVFLEPLQNTGGRSVPPPGYFARVRDVCDRHGVLLVSDEVICAFGRLGVVRGRALRVPARHAHLRQGGDLGLRAAGGVLCRDFLAEPFLAGEASFAHGVTFGGHPSLRRALANLDVLAGEGIVEHVAALGPALGERLRPCVTCPSWETSEARASSWRSSW